MGNVYSDPEEVLMGIAGVREVKILEPYVQDGMLVPMQIFFRLCDDQPKAPPAVYFHLHRPEHLEKIDNFWWRIMRIEDVEQVATTN